MTDADTHGELADAHDVLAGDRVFGVERGDELVHGRGEAELERDERVAVEERAQRLRDRAVADVGEGEPEDGGEDPECVDQVRSPPGDLNRCKLPASVGADRIWSGIAPG